MIEDSETNACQTSLQMSMLKIETTKTSSEGIVDMIDQPSTSSQTKRNDSTTDEYNAGVKRTSPEIPPKTSLTQASSDLENIKESHCVVDRSGLEVTCADVNEQNNLIACGVKKNVNIHSLNPDLIEPRVRCLDRSSRFTLYEQVHKNSSILIRSLEGHRDNITGVAFSRTNLLFSCSKDGEARIWRVADFVCLDNCQHLTQVNDIAASQDGSCIATAANNCKVYLWNSQNSVNVGFLPHLASVQIVKFLPNSRCLASASDKTVTLWTAEDSKPVWKIPLNNSPISSISFSHDGMYIACGDNQGYVKLWNLSAQKLCSVTKAHTQKISSIAYNTDNSAIASCAKDGYLKLWSAKKFHCDLGIPQYSSAVKLRSVRYSPFYVKFLRLNRVVFLHDSRQYAIS